MIHRLVLSFFLLLTASCCLGEPQPPRIVTMGNGVTVILVEDHTAPVAAIDVWVKAGSATENANNNGVSHFIEHLAFTTTAKYGPGEMDVEMESLGATLDARTSHDWARFGVTVTSRYVPQAVSVLAEIILRPRFKELDIETERMVILDELAKKETDAFKVCRDYLSAALYGDHPYSRPIEGTRESIARLTRADIVAHYEKHFVGNAIAIVVVGDVDQETTVGEIGKAFQGLSAKGRTGEEMPAPKPLESQMTKTYHGSYKLGYVGIGFLGPVAADYKDVCATDVLQTHIGSGYRSWMAGELRDKKGLIDRGFADFLTERGPALISLIVSAPEEKTDAAKDEMLAKIASIRQTGISEEALSTAKRSLLGQYAFQSETPSGRAQTYGFYYAISDPQFAHTYTSCIQAIANEDIIRVAQKYMDPNRAAIVLIGPSRKDSP